jgi:branched-chain amino acid transport system substrate-binding protein
MHKIRHRTWFVVLLSVALLMTACGGGGDEDAGTGDGDSKASGEPIKVGGSLALTGFLAPSALLHQTAGKLYVDRLNKAGGLLGRPVKWTLVDDESLPDKASANYERLITEDEVDLITGPYGTGTVSSAINVAERYGYVLPNHTGSLTYLYDYDCHFPTWSSGRYPNKTIITDTLDMLETSGNPPKSIAFVVNEFPGSNYLAYGTKDGDEEDQVGAIDIAKERGYEVTDVSYPTDISDWTPIASKIRDADPDYIFNAGVGLDTANLIQALKGLNYDPKGIFGLWSAPGPIAALGEDAEDVMLAGLYFPSMAKDPEVKEIIDEYTTRAEKAETYPVFETQAASEWIEWEVLTQAAEGAGSLDQQEMCDWLTENGIDSKLVGHLDFTKEDNHYPGNVSVIGQLQEGEWQAVWPEDKKTSDVSYPSR